MGGDSVVLRAIRRNTAGEPGFTTRPASPMN